MNYDPAAAAGCGGQPHQGRWNQGGRGAIASLDFGIFNLNPLDFLLSSASNDDTVDNILSFLLLQSKFHAPLHKTQPKILSYLFPLIFLSKHFSLYALDRP